MIAKQSIVVRRKNGQGPLGYITPEILTGLQDSANKKLTRKEFRKLRDQRRKNIQNK